MQSYPTSAAKTSSVWVFGTQGQVICSAQSSTSWRRVSADTKHGRLRTGSCAFVPQPVATNPLSFMLDCTYATTQVIGRSD
jgi:hypothetical protein